MPFILTCVYVIYALTGLVIMLSIALKPKLFWPILLITTILGSGLMIQGYGLVDEYFLAMLVLGALLAISIDAIPKSKSTKTFWANIHQKIFIIFGLYMIFQSIRGVLVLHDFRVVRWLIYYCSLLLLFFLINRQESRLPDVKKTSFLIVVATIIYLVLYLLVGVLYEYLSQGSKWDLQGFVWAGTAAAVFPMVAGLPAALFLLKNSSRRQTYLSWLLFLISIVVAYYYKARSAVITILGFLVANVTIIKPYKIAISFLVFIILTILLADIPLEQFSQIIAKSALLHYQSESGRLDHAHAAWHAIQKNGVVLFFGYGIHTHRLIIGPYLDQLGYFSAGSIPKIIHTTGIAALMTDTGLIGMFLFYSLILATTIQILFSNRNFRLPLMLALGLISLWPIIADIQDMVLFYFLIMPSGLLIQLNRNDHPIWDHQSSTLLTKNMPGQLLSKPNIKKQKICFIAAADSIHSLKWINYFAGQNHEIHWISLTPPLETHRNSKIKFYYFKANSLLTLSKIFFLKINPLIKKIQPDIIHAHYAGMYGFLGALSRYHPFIITAWGSDILIATKSKIKRTLIKYSLKKADLVTCDADHMRKAIQRLGINADKIKIINFGIDTQKFTPQARSESFKNTLGINAKPLIISLRHLEPIYNIETLIRAMPIVIKHIPQARCIIIGSGSESQHLKTLSKTLCMQKNIQFLGRIANEKIISYMANADVYVSTALSDAGISASTAEAMACGVPVVITDTGENKKWIRSGFNGFIVPAQNPKMLAAKIIWLLQNPKARQSFGQRGRQIIQEKNDYYQEMAKMEKIYQNYAKKAR